MNFFKVPTKALIVRVGVIFIVVLAVSMVGISYYYNQLRQEKEAGPVVVITPLPNKFTLKATNASILGIDTTTSFTLESKESITEDVVKSAFVTEPKFAFKVESSDDNTFSIIPDTKLQDNTIYQFSIATATSEGDDPEEFAWAYQTKNPFKVLSTSPGDQASGVPLDTGIEIVFSNEKYVKPEEHVTIMPAVTGHFTRYRQTLVFVPDGLQPATVYTVTVDKDLGVEGSDETLGAQYQFKFETNSSDAPLPGVNFLDSFYEFTSVDKPFVAFWGDDAKLQAKVFKFNSFEDFSGAVKTQYSDIPYWASYSRQNNPYDTSKLTEVMSFTPTVIQPENYYSYFEFPETLPDGYYIIELKSLHKPAQAFLQITNLGASMEVSVDNTVIWAHNISQKSPANNAKVTFSGDNALSEQTNNQGIANFSTPASLKSTSSSVHRSSLDFFVVEKDGMKLLVSTKNSESAFWFYYGMGSVNRYYWGYVYTNRSLYLPTDTVHIWGFAQTRLGKSGDVSKLTAKLQNQIWEDGEYSYVTYDETELSVSDVNTFEGSLQFPNVIPGYYYIRIFDGDEVVATRGVEVATYTKPSYQIEVKPTKRAYYAGDDVVFNVTSTFFDGTPVPNIEMDYNGSFGEGTVKTDSSGKATLTKKTQSNPDTSNYGPDYKWFNIHAKNVEQTEISASASLYEFGSSYTMTAEAEDDGAYAVTVNNVTLDAMNATGPNDFVWEYLGSPVAGAQVGVTIKHVYYEKTANGTWYDFINKKVITNYTYTRKENTVATKTITTNNEGKAESSFTPDAEKNYEIEFIVSDPNGRKAKTTAWMYHSLGQNYYNYVEGNVFSFISENDVSQKPSKYLSGSTIPLQVYKNSEPLVPDSDDAFLYSVDYNGLRDVATSTQASHDFIFKKEYEPNFYARGIYFDGRYYHLIVPDSNSVDTTDRELEIKVAQDKDSYSPGEKVKMDVTVSDKDGKLVKNAEVNVSNIDQALAAIQWNSSVSILSSLYSNIASSVNYVDITHEEPVTNQAEGGGCFGPQTLITMADGTKKEIQNVVVGDKILTKANSNMGAALVETTVEETFEHIVNNVMVINGTLQVTPEHIVWLNDAWKPMRTARVGDWLRNDKGDKILIASIGYVLGSQRVYNLHTANFHTFLADNTYVHNEKAGGGVRDDLEDIAFFGSARTNAQGVATFSFDLPDNITSWLTTVQAITEDRMAGGVQTSIIATKPFFVDVSNAESYLASDNPVVRVRGFGVGLNPDSEINFEISFPGTTIEKISKTEKAFTPVDIALPDLPVGTSKIQVKGVTGNMQDILEKEFKIVSTYHMQSKADFNILSEGAVPLGSDTLLTTISFSNNETGRYYWATRTLHDIFGDRIDQKLGRKIGAQLLKTYFDEESESQSVTVSDFQQDDGGFSVLPFSSSEVLFSAKVMNTLSVDQYDSVKAIDFLYDKLRAQNSTTDEAIAALLGLAGAGEPVLTDANIFLSHEDISPKQRLYLIRAVAEMGAKEYAHGLLIEYLEKYAKLEEPYMKVVVGDDTEETTEVTYQAAIVASIVGAEEAFPLFDYATRNHTQYQLHTLDQIAYLEHILASGSLKPVSFSYTLNGKTEQVSLKKNERLVLALSPEDRKSITFSNLQGSIATVSRYEAPLDIATVEQDSRLKVSRSYSVNGKATNSFKQGDLVKITISYSVASDSLEDSYMLVDYLPSGMKPLINTWHRGIYDQNQHYPYEINGQAAKFWAGRTSTTSFNYYAIITSTGSYLGDAPTLQGYKVTNSRAFGTSTQVEIE